MTKGLGEKMEMDSLVADATAQKIIEAAIRIVREEGYENLTIRKVAKESGCSNSAIYIRFADKDALANAVVEVHAQPFLDILNQNYRKEDDFLTNIKRIAFASMYRVRQMDLESIRMQIFYRGRFALSENPFVGRLTEYVALAMEKGELENRNPLHVAYSMFSAFWGIALMQCANATMTESLAEELLGTQVDLIYSGLKHSGEKLSFWDVLKSKGVSVDKALERMKGNKEAYREFLVEFFEDPDFETLADAIARQSTREAFECAHGLKGMAANLGLDEIQDALSVLVEILRRGVLVGVEDAYSEVMKASEKVKNIL